MQGCQRHRVLLLGPDPNQDPDPGLTPDPTLEAAPAQDPENVATVLGLVPVLVLTLRPTETIPAGTIRTTEVGSEATTEATGGLITIVAETEATTNAVITRTGAAAMAIRPIGRVVVVVVVVEAGTIVTTTRTTTHTAPGGGAQDHARPRSAQAAGAAPTTPTALLQEGLDAQGAPATLRGPGPHHLAIAAARAPKMQRTS